MIDEGSLAEYVEELFVREPPLLTELRKTLAEGDFPTIQVPARTGRVLELVARMVGARRVLEIGTLGGYSALWLLRGMPEDGRILTLEREPAHAELARRFLARGGAAGRVEVREGDARQLLPDVGPDGDWDLVFVDADKQGYLDYLEAARRLLRPGGVVLADNVLWSGRILEDQGDEATEALKAFNRTLAASPDFRATILPVGDGVALGVREG